MSASSCLPDPPNKIWRIRPSQNGRAEELARTFHLSELAARLLALRDLPDERAVKTFLEPAMRAMHDPFLMRDMEPAAERVARAVRDGECVAVYGDYDVDGLTATALLMRFFNWLGVQAEPYVPHRLKEGYGMSREGVEALHKRGARLIVTVDNGVTCFDEIAYARELGMDVVVTDHHHPAATLPEGAVAVVDPQRTDCTYPFKHLSGVGVAFKLAHAAAKRLGKSPRSAKTFLKGVFDLVALGTVADVVPLLGENRIFVMHGLEALLHTDKPGLCAMRDMLGLGEKGAVSAENIAFLYGPRLNAAGRIGDPHDGLELLTTEDAERAEELSRFLDRQNASRRAIEEEVLKDVHRQIEQNPSLVERPVLVVAGEGWHQGAVGIIASRLVERFGRPALVLGMDEGRAKGSARSLNGFDLYAALEACAERLTTFGGHKMAAGLSLPSDEIDAFREEINAYAEATLTGEALRPMLELDTAARISELSMEALEQLDRLRPFGEGNPEPTVALLGCELFDGPFDIKGRHLKLRVIQRPPQGRSGAAGPMTAIWFRCPPNARALVESGRPFDVAGVPKINVWRDHVSVEITVKDMRPAENA